jgi:hypothetical protein
VLPKNSGPLGFPE